MMPHARFAVLLALIILTGACNQSPTAPTPISTPAPSPPAVVAPAPQEMLIASHPFKLDPCVERCKFKGSGADIPALGKGTLRVSITLLEPQANLGVTLWSDRTPEMQDMFTQVVTTTQDPADKTLGNGSKAEVVFDQYDGEVRYITVYNLSPITLHGGRQIVYIK